MSKPAYKNNEEYVINSRADDFASITHHNKYGLDLYVYYSAPAIYSIVLHNRYIRSHCTWIKFYGHRDKKGRFCK